MFKGTYLHTVDEKGRVRVPTKLKESLGESFTVSRGIGKCVFVFPESEWNALEDKLRALPITDIKSQKFVRMFLASAIDCPVDKQGRVLLPQLLREYAELKDEIVFIGAGSRVEIWNKSVWDEYTQCSNEEFDEILAGLAAIGI